MRSDRRARPAAAVCATTDPERPLAPGSSRCVTKVGRLRAAACCRARADLMAVDRNHRRNCNLKLDSLRAKRPDQPCNYQQSRALHCNQYLDGTTGRRSRGRGRRHPAAGGIPRVRGVWCSRRRGRAVRGVAMSNIARRPDGRWRARYRDATGREHSKHFPARSTRRTGSTR
jgi:hypothetical protein